MTTKYSAMIHQSNIRVWAAISAVRIQRVIETVTELRDALNTRRQMRIGLTKTEKEKLFRAYQAAENQSL